MPTNAKKTVYREKEFGIYALWKSLPPHARGMTKKELFTLGYTDPIIATIIKIKNQSEFARAFRIKDLGTLTDWNTKIARGLSPSPSVTNTLAPRRAEIREKILLPQLSELNLKIRTQQRELTALKRENALLRRKSTLCAPRRMRQVPHMRDNSKPKQDSLIIPSVHAAQKEHFSITAKFLERVRGVFSNKNQKTTHESQ